MTGCCQNPKNRYEQMLQNGDATQSESVKLNDGVPATAREREGSPNGGDYQRGTWSGKLDFLLSVVGYSVGVSNIWRFPYLCVKNGGGAFLIPFFFFLIFAGIPLFFMELCLGQFSGTSSLFVWKLCPLFKGLGYLMVTISAVISWYYIMVLAWVAYFLVNSFYSTLPWSSCDNTWNTNTCIKDISFTAQNSTYNVTSHNNSTYCYLSNVTSLPLEATNCSYLAGVGNVTGDRMTAAEEFWKFNLLNISSGLDDVGPIQWHLALTLLFAWFIIFLSLMKGVKTVGKVVYVTAVLPYFLLTTFLVQGLMLPGSVDGILYYVTPQFDRLLNFQVWLEAGIQVFYSLGPAWGGLITMASYNKFDNNCLRDAIIGSMADGLTSFYAGFVVFSVLGFMAHEANQSIEDVSTSGPGLALVAYPEAISRLPFPQIWAVLFFLMLLTLGIDSQFGTFETVSSGLVDAFPKQLRHRKVLLTACLCCMFFLLGLPFVTRAGIYVFQLVDWYASSFCVLFTSFLECIIVGWIYGADRFSRDIELMIGSPAPAIMRICWCFVTPTIMLVALLVTIVQYQPPVYDGYTYPGYARAVGLLLATLPILPVPGFIAYEMIKAEGTWVERLKYLIQPAADWGPHIRKYRRNYNSGPHWQENGFISSFKMNLLGRKQLPQTEL
ncbi:hypothetical protein ScPMuIL_001308 [Solemya velum]